MTNQQYPTWFDDLPDAQRDEMRAWYNGRLEAIAQIHEDHIRQIAELKQDFRETRRLALERLAYDIAELEQDFRETRRLALERLAYDVAVRAENYRHKIGRQKEMEALANDHRTD